MTTPILSIVIGTVDRYPHAQKFVQSVYRHALVDYELIISDASKVTQSFEYNDRTTIIHEIPRLGHAAGYNQAFRQCKGKWVVWLNDDCEVTAGWDRAAVAFMEQNYWCGLGALYYSENGDPYHINDYQGMIYSNFGILQKEFGDEIGWFDADICRHYASDNSITFKTILAGRGVAGIRDSKVKHNPILDVHKQEALNRQGLDAGMLMSRYRNKLDLMRRIQKQFPTSPLILE